MPTTHQSHHDLRDHLTDTVPAVTRWEPVRVPGEPTGTFVYNGDRYVGVQARIPAKRIEALRSDIVHHADRSVWSVHPDDEYPHAVVVTVAALQAAPPAEPESVARYFGGLR